MKDLIKTIRTKLNLNQEQLASLMGVSPVTVNRWENGKVNPSFMAQKQLYEISLNNQLNLAEYIIERERADEEFMRNMRIWQMDMMSLSAISQMVAITQKACDHIKIITEHRRDGRYFDEILRGVE